MTKWIGVMPVEVLRVIGSVAHVQAGGRRAMVPEAWLMDSEPMPPASRVNDHETSKKAGYLTTNRDTHRHRLLATYEHIRDGFTDEEAATMAGLGHACYWKRCGELRATGMIEDTGSTRKGYAGTERIVCEITDAGRRRLRFLREQI